MSDREDDSEAIMWSYFRMVSPELLSKFFYERSVPTVICPICNGSDIAVPKATENVNGVDVTYVHPSKIENFGFEPRSSLLQYHYRLICKNCGFESRFSVNPVFLWIQEKEKMETKFNHEL